MLIVGCVILTPIDGLEGLLVVNICVQLFVSLVVEAYMLYKHGFAMSPLPYYANVLKYSIIAITLTLLSLIAVSMIPGMPLMRFLLGGVVSVCIGFGGFALLAWRMPEFGFVKGIVRSLAASVTSKLKAQN